MGQRTLPTSNEGADKRRIAARIAELETRATTPARAAEVVGSVRIEEAENRVRMFFPDQARRHRARRPEVARLPLGAELGRLATPRLEPGLVRRARARRRALV